MSGSGFLPQERLKHLIEYSNSVAVDYSLPPMRYYRSGIEMIRMANVYYEEGNLENAYVLYMKFMTIFLEKIRKHPALKEVPKKMKTDNQAILRQVLPKAEKIKEELLQLYKKEYERYQLEEERRRSVVPTPTPLPQTLKKSSNKNSDFISVEQPPNFDKITYPLDPSLPTPSSTPVSGIVPVEPPNKVPTAPAPVPAIDRSNKPSQIFQNHYDNTGKLRPVVVPSKVMTQFQLMAQKNTVRNIETCGILAGKLEQNELIVTNMILPKQKGTADSCVTMNEEELFDYQDQHNLITIGWIHTHPSQTAFLSSVDLHTQCPYQLLMPEAIAIVIAPKFNETGFFVLTPDYGLKFIADCRKTGFHPHPTEPPLFMVAEHVRIMNESLLEVIDLRNDK